MKHYRGYTDKMKFKVISVYKKTGDMVKAREAVGNKPALVTCYGWVRDANLTNNKTSHTRYSLDIKRRAVIMYYENNRNVSKVAKALGVSNTAIAYWVNQILPADS